MTAYRLSMYFMLLIAICILSSCTSSLPVMDANIMDCNVTLSGRGTVTKDKLTYSDNMVNRKAGSLNSTSVYNFPFNVSYGQKLGSRLELGGYILGLYGKFLVVKPDSYNKFSLNNVAVSIYAAANEAGILTGGHYIEELAETGLLFGIPLYRGISLSTGVTGKYSINVDTWDDYSDEDDILESTGLTAIRKSVVILVNLLFKFPVIGDVRMFGYVNGNIPFDIREEYHLNIRYDNEDKIEYKPSFLNRNNYSLRVGFGMMFNKKDKGKSKKTKDRGQTGTDKQHGFKSSS